MALEGKGPSVTEQLGVIFDMDGVLVDSTEAHYAAWCGLAREIGVTCPRDVFERTFGMHNRQIIPLWLERELPDEELDRLSRRKEEIYREVAPGLVTALPGVRGLIDALARESDFTLAVGSSGPRANIELVLELLDAAEKFAALSTGDEVRHGKPNPEVFLIAARKLALPPARCVVIEDAPQGVKAGLAAGAKVVAVTSTKPAADLREADVVVDALSELGPRRLRGLFRR